LDLVSKATLPPNLDMVQPPLKLVQWWTIHI